MPFKYSASIIIWALITGAGWIYFDTIHERLGFNATAALAGVVLLASLVIQGLLASFRRHRPDRSKEGGRR
jgi:hypothetical protein